MKFSRLFAKTLTLNRTLRDEKASNVLMISERKQKGLRGDDTSAEWVGKGSDVGIYIGGRQP
jgi:hypothetical protein